MALTAKELAARTTELKDVPPLEPLFDIAMHWLEIALALLFFYIFPSLWTLIAVWLFISARQYALLVLLHDGQHTLLHPDKEINRLIATWLIALPCGTLFIPFQKTHLSHHQHLGSREADPDYRWYCYGDPCPKRTASELLRLYTGGIIATKLHSLFKGQAQQKAASPDLRQMLKNLWPLILVQGIFLILFTLVFGWYGYFLLWMLPLATFATSYNNFRIFCEHSNAGVVSEDPAKLLVSYISNPVERFFIAPNHMNYHAEHHLFPYVPHSCLPELRELIRQCPEVEQTIQWRGSYLSHLRNYLRQLPTIPSHAA